MKPKDLDELKEMLGVESLPGTSNFQKTVLQWTQKLVRERGPNYIRENRQLLLAQLDDIWNDLI